MISDATLRAALKLTPTAIEAPVLAEFRDRAIAFVERQTTRYFGAPRTVTEYVEGNGARALTLAEAVRAGTPTVEERGCPGAAATAVTTFALRREGTRSVLVRTDGWWRLGWEYAVTYEQGYADDAGPGDIAALVIALVGQRLATRGKEGLASETIGGYAYTHPAIHAFEDGDLRAIPGAVRTLEAWRPLVFR